MKKEQRATLREIGDKLAAVCITTEAIHLSLDRSISCDFSSNDVTEKSFLQHYKDGVATANIIKAALDTIIKEQDVIFEMLESLN